MKPLEAMITGCVVFFALLLAASIYSGARGSMKIERPGEGPRSYSHLAQDEIMLAADMRKLHRDLRAAPVKFGLHGNATRFVRTGLILSPSAA